MKKSQWLIALLISAALLAFIVWDYLSCVYYVETECIFMPITGNRHMCPTQISVGFTKYTDAPNCSHWSIMFGILLAASAACFLKYRTAKK